PTGIVPELVQRLEELVDRLLLSQPVRVIGGRGALRVASVKDQGGGPIRIGRSEESAHHAPFRGAQQGGARGARGIHDGPDVIHPLLQRGKLAYRYPIRDARTAILE